MNDDATATLLLQRAADALAGHAPAPPAASLLAAANARRDRRRATVVAVAAAVAGAVFAVGAVLPSGPDALGPAQDSTAPPQEPSAAPRPPYTGTGPELGQADGPLSVAEGDRIAAGGDAPPPDQRDLLAQADLGGVVAALFGFREQGQLCAVFALKRPAFSQSLATECGRDGSVPLSEAPLAIRGDSPARPAAGATPAATYGGLPAGTRRVRLERPGQLALVVDAFDAGDAYGRRAYFAAAWDLRGDEATTVTAFSASGRSLGSVSVEPRT
jgi:hypothetical protein